MWYLNLHSSIRIGMTALYKDVKILCRSRKSGPPCLPNNLTGGEWWLAIPKLYENTYCLL